MASLFSSAIPSAKYSRSFFSLMSANGRTAIECSGGFNKPKLPKAPSESSSGQPAAALHGYQMVAESFEWPHIANRIVTVVLFLGVPVVAILA